MTNKLPAADAWTRARNRFIEDLTDDEKRVYYQASPETILYDASAAEKVHANNSFSRGLLGKIQPFVATVEQYAQALDVFSNAYPLVLSPLWGSIRIVLQLASGVMKYFERLVDMFAQIGEVLPRIAILETLFPDHERLIQALSATYFDILTFCSNAKHVFRAGQHSFTTTAKIAMKSNWVKFERQFETQLSTFRKHQKTFEKEANLSHMIEAAESRALVSRSKEQREKERRETARAKLLSSLSAVDYNRRQRQLSKRRYPGTGQWLLEEDDYKQWKHSNSSESLCCYGIPGSGKSVLASTVIDDLEGLSVGPGCGLLYYYCDYSDPSSLQIERFFGTILKQLLLGDAVSREVENRLSSFYLGNAGMPAEDELCDLVCSALTISPVRYVVLDGLDECETGTQKSALQFLRRLGTLQNIIKVLIFCTESGYIQRSTLRFQHIHISPQSLTHDIKSFVAGTVEKRLESDDLRIRDRGLRSEVIARLTDKAQGMFLWVYFQLDDLCEALSDNQIRETLDNLPEGLIETYKRVLAKISSKRSKALLASKVFKWLACAKRPLHVEEMKEAVAFEPSDRSWNGDKIPDADLLLECCRGLVVRDEIYQTVHFAHHTIQQYLLSDLTAALSDTETFGFGRQEAEIFALTNCITYLNFSDFETQIIRREPETKLVPSGILQSRAHSQIPGVLGISNAIFEVPYRLRGGNRDTKAVDIDYSKYLKPVRKSDDQAVARLKTRYQLLEYVVDFWEPHSRWLGDLSSTKRHVAKSIPQKETMLHELAQNKQLAFEFRPWGPNQHYGPYGCKTCASSVSDGAEFSLMSLVHYAAEVGNIPLLRPLIEKYSLHEKYHGETFLIACRYGQLDMVNFLIRTIELDLSDGRAVNEVAVRGHQSILEFLVQADFPHVEKNRYPVERDGHIPLEIASLNGHIGIVNVLCDLEADVNKSSPSTTRRALQSAALNGYDAIVRRLVIAGADVGYPGGSALIDAAAYGHEKVTETLLSLGASQHFTDADGEAALHKVARNGYISIVQLLLRYGFRYYDQAINSNNVYNGCRALDLAAQEGQFEIVRLLSKSPSDANRRVPGSGQTALHMAAAYGHCKTLRTLVQCGGWVDSKDCNGCTPLMYAATAGHWDAVVELRSLEIADRTSGTDVHDNDVLDKLINEGYPDNEKYVVPPEQRPTNESLSNWARRGLPFKSEISQGEKRLHLDIFELDGIERSEVGVKDHNDLGRAFKTDNHNPASGKASYTASLRRAQEESYRRAMDAREARIITLLDAYGETRPELEHDQAANEKVWSKRIEHEKRLRHRTVVLSFSPFTYIDAPPCGPVIASSGHHP